MRAYWSLFWMLVALSASAQPKPLPTYARDWKRADSLLAKGLPQSALDIANRIYREAKSQKNYPQLAKAAMARMVYRTYSDEDAYRELIRSLQVDIADTPEPAKSVLQSVLADSYWQYFQQNRYKFYDRATLGRATLSGKTTPNRTPRGSGVNKSTSLTDTTDDFTRWDASQLIEAVTEAYLASVETKSLLQQTPVSAYEVLLEKGDPEARLLRPTLFDLLAHRAIAFFQNTEPNLLKPVFRFVLDQPAYLDVPAVFTGLTLQSRDSLSGQYQALVLFQQLLRFHLNDATPDALADVDVLRLAFVHRNSVVPRRDSLYRKTLEKQIDRYKHSSVEATYGFQLAQFLANYGSPVRPRDQAGNPAPDSARWNRKQAAAICRDLIRRFPNALAAKQAAQLLNQLLRASYSWQVEQVNVSQRPFRALINYQNVRKVLYRIIRVSVSEKQLYDKYGNEDERKKLYTAWLKHKAVVEDTVSLPDDGDLNQHSVEIPVSGLPLGQYILLTTMDNKFQAQTESVQYVAFAVSNLSYLILPTGQAETLQTIVTTNRTTGEPLKNVAIAFISNQSTTSVRPQKMGETNTNGWTKISTSLLPNQTSFQYLITRDTDTLLSERQYYYRNMNQPEEQSQRYSKLFTDRAIYRPGQPIYVKGLVYEGKKNAFTVLPDQDIAIEFVDQNGERIAKQTVKTNEFGTFNTDFAAPTGRLTGQMILQTPYSQAVIRVEEYKRPTFSVKTEPVTQSVKLGQTVSVSATVKTFSGAVVDGAEVRYRVVRRRRPRWDWWYSGTIPFRDPGINNQAEIASGTTQTDTQGNLSISFVAQPDLVESRTTNPVFDFEVTIDVTDRAGETRSATTTLHIGYAAFQLSLGISPQIETDTPITVPVRITNQAGRRVAAIGQLSLYRLQPPGNQLRKRLWPQPDRYILSQNEFKTLFPNDVYANENDPRTWPKGELVQQLTVHSPADSLITLKSGLFTAGEYVAELTVIDSTGERITERDFFAAINDKQPTASVRPDNWIQARKTMVEPGEEAIFWVGNSQPGWVLITVEEDHKTTRQEWLKTDGKPRRIMFPVTAKQRGGFAVHFAMVQNGRLYEQSQLISVPFTNKQLTIETETFRDKLKPGAREEWTLRIKGLDKLPAELIATLYDASLDTFVPLAWPTSIYQPYSLLYYVLRTSSFGITSSNLLFYRYRPEAAVPTRQYDQLDWPVYLRRLMAPGGSRRTLTGAVAKMSAASSDVAVMAAPKEEQLVESVAAEPSVSVGYGTTKKSETKQIEVLNPRRNFNETAFFLPNLKADEQGRVVLRFTMPDALTRWRLLAFAHTKDLKIGTLEREIVTQKELMITTNAPRFLREGDTIRMQARVNNLSEKTLDGMANLTLMNALTGEPVSQTILQSERQQSISVGAGQSKTVGWTLIIPTALNAVTCRFSAQAGNFTDGEEFTIPILPNRMLVTDTKPFWVNGKETKSFKLKELTSFSPELPVQHERLTVEVTSNPAWYALQALPYLMEYRYECAEQLFSRLYANSLAAHIVTSKPAFRRVINQWQKTPPTNPLQASAELKAVSLENSPWLAEAKSEKERQARLGQLLDANRMENEQLLVFAKLEQLQTESGGFRWFGGMQPDLSMTLHILSGFGHLQKLGVRFPDALQAKRADMQIKAVAYADAELKEWVAEQQKTAAQHKVRTISPWYFTATQYLYARSFYTNSPIDKTVLTYLKEQITNNWLSGSLQGQALAAMALKRYGEGGTAKGIINSLRERARKTEELGMYWPDNLSGLYWYQAPIETQAYLIEAFNEIDPAQAEIDDMKRWLLRQKQTQSWPSTKATTEAVYALLLRGSDWLGTGVTTQVSLGGQPIENRVTTTDDIAGYEKVTYAASEIRPEMGNIIVSKTSEGPAWGALYWQHFEPMDQVLAGSAGLSVQKTLFVQRDSPSGPFITPVTAQTSLKPGDLIRVRLVLKTDRLMEYVHLKDSRASGFEPIAALSGYRYQNGLGYYESPRDASTDFFISALPVGTHVFEYDLRVAQTGDFSAGIATVQCFYAPEFSAHSAGERVNVKQ